MTKTPRGGTGAPSKTGRFSVRIHTQNPDHHLWWNRGSWWFHGTVHLEDSTKHRVRTGLGTKDIIAARGKRDQILLAGRAEVSR